MPDPGVYLYEFLYRGRPKGSAEPSDYHVILARAVEDPFTKATMTTTSQAMTPDGAKALGFDLATIVAAVDPGPLAATASLQAPLAAAQLKIETLQEALDARPPEPATAEAQPTD